MSFKVGDKVRFRTLSIITFHITQTKVLQDFGRDVLTVNDVKYSQYEKKYLVDVKGCWWTEETFVKVEETQENPPVNSDNPISSGWFDSL